MSEATLHPPTRLLFGPGPTMVEPRVTEALGKPIVGPLDPYFFEVADSTRELLRLVFGTRNETTLVIPGTGSAGMETGRANFMEPGCKIAVVGAGDFCDQLAAVGVS